MTSESTELKVRSTLMETPRTDMIYKMHFFKQNRTRNEIVVSDNPLTKLFLQHYRFNLVIAKYNF